jgi:hypothetical protein
VLANAAIRAANVTQGNTNAKAMDVVKRRIGEGIFSDKVALSCPAILRCALISGNTIYPA